MTRYDLLRLVLAVETILAGAALVSIFAHAVWRVVGRNHYGPRLERGRRVLRAAVHGERVEGADAGALHALPVRLLIRLFVELVPSVTGSARARLGELAREIGLIGAAERMCASALWWERLHGVRLLAVVGGGEEVVPPLFRDPHPAIRSAAVEWAAENATGERTEALVRLLARPDRFGRFVLRDSLIRIGPSVIEPLARYLEAHGGREAEAALQVAAGLPDARFAQAALRLCADPLPEARAGAAALLGELGGAAAVDILQQLIADPDAGVRAAAAGAIGRLGHWPASPALARLLRDPAWVVRSRSALALRSLGSPGLLYLRRTLGDPDPFAADMARQVLDLPDVAADRARRA